MYTSHRRNELRLLPEKLGEVWQVHARMIHPPGGSCESETVWCVLVVSSTTSLQEIEFEHAITGPDIVAFQRLVRRVPVSEPVMRYAVDLVRRSRPESPDAPEFIKEWVDYGASVRAAQYLILGGKTRALLQGRYHVSFEDIRALAPPVLRHRIVASFAAEAEGVSALDIVDKLLADVGE